MPKPHSQDPHKLWAWPYLEEGHGEEFGWRGSDAGVRVHTQVHHLHINTHTVLRVQNKHIIFKNEHKITRGF